MRGLLACAVALAGCGRLRFDARDDASGDGTTGTDVDVGIDTVGSGPWGPAVPIVELTSGMGDDDPSLTADQLEIYFSSNRSGSGDIYRATRTLITDPWGTPFAVAELNGPAFNDNTPEIAGDGLTLYFASSRTGGDDIYMSTRPTRMDAWSTPVIVTELSTPRADVAPTLVDETTMYLGSVVPTLSNEIQLSTRASASVPWSTPTVVTELSTPSFDSDPFVTTDDLVIYWASTRGATETNLWQASRTTRAEPFSGVAPITELNTADDEDDPWMSPDGHTLYFARGVGLGNLSIYMTTR